jgi:8-amino-7-oxononanoate synthase
MGGRDVVMAGSNDYLALSTDGRLKAAAAVATERWGTGNSGSRVLNGSLEVHEELEARLAAFAGTEAAMVTTTGFQANLCLSPLLGTSDVVLADQYIHASMIEAVRLGHARMRRYRHNDMAHLQRLLHKADPDAGLLIFTEGMFSASGDLCDLPAIVRLARRHAARVIVDGAHDIGLLGRDGRGVAEHYGQESAVDLYTLTFSKCFGTLGGAVAGPERVIRYLRHEARAMLFSASLPAACAAAALTALRIIREEPERRRRVLASAERLRAGLSDLGFDVTPSVSPTIPVHVGDTLLCCQVWRELLSEGVYTNAMVPPAVPPRMALIRTSVTADHTDAHLDRIVHAFATVGRRLNLTGRAA